MNSYEKTAEMLKLLAQPPFTHRVTELGEKIGMPKSGACKLLAALVKSGLAVQTENRKYALGPAVYLLGNTYEENFGLGRLIRPYLVQLRDMTGENSSFTKMVDGEAVLLYREEGLRQVRVVGEAGQVRPMYAGATGKIIGAFRPEEEIRQWLEKTQLIPFTSRTIVSPADLMDEYAAIRENKYAISWGELNSETMGVGVPVWDNAGNVWAAISIGAPIMRMNEAKTQQFIVILKEMSRQITESVFGTYSSEG